MRRPLVLQDLTKRYGQGAPVIAGLNATVAPGTATGLVGPNGSGKTTLLRLLAALAYPTEGRILYGDLDVHAHPHRFLRHVGLVYADAGLPEHLSAVELLEWILRERRAWDAGAPARITAALDHVRLDERRHTLIGTYSSGMIQKTQLAAALIHEPAVLLMDEPFRGLDAESTAAVMGFLQAFKTNGGLLVVSSHARALLDALCDDFIDLQPL
jgi:ABC-2 type transport system ATP-binding protein